MVPSRVTARLLVGSQAALLLLLAMACEAQLGPFPAQSSTLTGSGGSLDPRILSGPSDLPCTVQQVLATRCQSCHFESPPGPLLTYDDLRSTSLTDPQLNQLQRALQLVVASDSTRMPPPPENALSDGEVQTLQDWLQAGTPRDNCTEPTLVQPGPYDTPVICTTNSHWRGGNEESPLMNPGMPCIQCHEREHEGPRYDIAGTVYPTAHEPDRCNGSSAEQSAYLSITDAKARVFEVPINRAGNFYLTASLALPYRAKVVSASGERVMHAAQTDGDCNTCHSQDGSNGAPGRVMLP